LWGISILPLGPNEGSGLFKNTFRFHAEIWDWLSIHRCFSINPNERNENGGGGNHLRKGEGAENPRKSF